MEAHCALSGCRCCRRPYFALENNFHTLFAMCKPMPGYKDSDAQSRRETSAKILTSLIQRDVEARKLLVTSGALKSVLELLNPEGAFACSLFILMDQTSTRL
eukprot:1159965-Pelagomonas_calceolata.AAC.3